MRDAMSLTNARQYECDGGCGEGEANRNCVAMHVHNNMCTQAWIQDFRATMDACRDARAWERSWLLFASQLTTIPLGNTTRDAAYWHRPQHDGMGALHIFTRQLHGYLRAPPPHVAHLTPQGTSTRQTQGATEK